MPIYIIMYTDTSVYLGIEVSERLMESIFTPNEIMPYGHHGYDFIYNGKKIDVKSSATYDKYGYWILRINKNTIADTFLFIVFDNPININPMHLWEIPREDVNHLTDIKIQDTNIYKWNKYELSLDDVINKCDDLKQQLNKLHVSHECRKTIQPIRIPSYYLNY